MVAGSRPIAVQTRLVTSASTAAHSSTSLKCGSGSPGYSSREPSRLRTGGRSPLLSSPSTRSLAGTRSLSPCWYWMPIASRPKSSAMRSAAMYILHWLSSWPSVSSVASSPPVRNVIPARSSQARTACASSSPTCAHLGDERGLAEALLVDPGRVEQLVVDDRVVHPHAAFVEDADDRLLALQLSRERPRELDLRAAADVAEGMHVARVVGQLAGLEPVCRHPRAQSSVKSSLHSVEWRTPALVRLAVRLSIPTSPGNSPLQLATSRIGPRWVRRPGSTWWLYCQTASTTTSGASGGSPLKTSIPARWLSMNPCPPSASTG